MTPLRKENLELELTNNIAFMSVTGEMTADSLNEGLAWIDQASEANDNFNICVDLKSENFDDLSAARQQFLNVGRVLRHAPCAEKCAVLTDSDFLKNSAKVEGAVIPGLEINAFDLNEAETAEKWLNGEPIIDEAPQEQEQEAEPLSQPELVANPWDNLNMAKVDI
mgnify:CR=1 FL=1